MPVGLLPEHTASRIVALHEQLNSLLLDTDDRVHVGQEMSRLWDEAFPGKPYEDIVKVARPFLLMS